MKENFFILISYLYLYGWSSFREFSPDIGAYNDALASRYAATKAEGWAVNDLIAETMSERSIDVRIALDLGAGTGQTTRVVESLFHPQALSLRHQPILSLRSQRPSKHLPCK